MRWISFMAERQLLWFPGYVFVWILLSLALKLQGSATKLDRTTEGVDVANLFANLMAARLLTCQGLIKPESKLLSQDAGNTYKVTHQVVYKLSIQGKCKIHRGPKTQPLFCCHRKVWHILNGHPVWCENQMRDIDTDVIIYGKNVTTSEFRDASV